MQVFRINDWLTVIYIQTQLEGPTHTIRYAVAPPEVSIVRRAWPGRKATSRVHSVALHVARPDCQDWPLNRQKVDRCLDH